MDEQESLEIEDGFVKVIVSSIESKYAITYTADGTGKVFSYEYQDDDPFRHDLDLAQIRAVNQGEAALQNFLVDHFWSVINPGLNDPLIRDYDELDGYELEFQKGNQVEFDRLVRLFILTEPNIEKHAGDEVLISAAAPEDDYYRYYDYGATVPAEKESSPSLLNWAYYSERLSNLVKLTLKEHYPFGYVYEYNDQAYDRFSGYSMLPVRLEYKIGETLQISAREKMAARHELAQWLVARGENPANYGLDWEKIV
jgi:hypothetical protein